jgi:CBS domain containing-hemolysin-like protein
VLGLSAVLVLVLLNAACVGGEFALVAVDRSKIQRSADEGNRRARGVLRSLRELSFQLSAAQVGITVSSLVLGFIAEPTIGVLVEPVVEALGAPESSAAGISIAVALVLASVVQMVVGELMPKSFAIANPVATAMVFAGPLRWFSTILRPLIRLLDGTATATLRLFHVESKDELASARSLAELGILIRSSAEQLDLAEDEVRMLTRAVRFAGKSALDVLVPRVDVVTLSAQASVLDLVERSVATGHSRFPVMGDDVDDIVGFVHVKDVLEIAPSERGDIPVARIMKPAVVVPETRELDSLLSDLRRAGVHLAMVVDEHGGTAGIVTIEDILEEIVGEIEDEYDPIGPPVVGGRFSREIGVVTLEGRTHADEVHERTGLSLPEGDYETLAGFLLDRLGRIPEPGDVVIDHTLGAEFTVIEIDGLRISSVRVTRLQPGPSGPS